MQTHARAGDAGQDSGAFEWSEGELWRVGSSGEGRVVAGKLEVAEDAANGGVAGDEGQHPAARAAGVTGEDVDTEHGPGAVPIG